MFINALKQAHDIQVNVIVRPNERKLTVATCNRIELFRESSFNTTRGGWRYWGGGGLRKFLDTQKGGCEKIRGGAPKICRLQNQQEGGPPKKLNH